MTAQYRLVEIPSESEEEEVMDLTKEEENKENKQMEDYYENSVPESEAAGEIQFRSGRRRRTRLLQVVSINVRSLKSEIWPAELEEEAGEEG